ncbi:MAG: glycosyltransferase [Candidatus Marinamargulisbacteria bacterium]
MSIQNIGLLMTYNEIDIIREVMDNNLKYFDKILVLDGSNDGTTEIIRSYKNVVYLIHDDEIVPKRKISDGMRQFLLEKAQELFPIEGWFTILHGDEILVDNPNEIALRAEKAGAEKVNWHALNFFLHTSEKGKKIHLDQKIQDQVKHYTPGGLEIRQFKNKPNIHYDITRTGCVFPYGIKPKILLDYPIFKHYVIRGPQQFKNKDGTWSTKITRNEHNEPDIYFDQINHFGKQVRIYDGSFHEFEPENRPPFIIQYLNWHKYRTVDWGMFSFIKKIFPFLK